MRLRHGRNQSPIIRIAGCQNEGVRIILEEFPAGASSEPDVHQGFVFLDPLDDFMLHGNVGEFIENIPCRGGMDIIIEDNLSDLMKQGILV